MTTDSVIPIVDSQAARRAARNAGVLAVASLVSKGVLFGWQMILAPFLGPYDYGIYGTVVAFTAIAMPIASFGMSIIVIRDVARYPARAGKYLTTTLFLQTALALLAYVAINVAAGALGYGDFIRGFVALAGISLIVDMFGNMCHDQLLAQERMMTTSMIEVGHIALRVVMAGGLLLAGYGLVGVYGATIFSGIVRAALLWFYLMRSGVRPEWPLDLGVARPLLANSAPLALSAFLSLTYSHTDKLMTTAIIGAQGSGYLTAAFVIIFGMIEMLSTTVLVATFPMMSRYFGSPAFAFMVEKLAFFTAVITLPITLLLSLFSTELTMVFGDDFRPTAAVLAVLVWYALITMVNNVFAQGMMIQNRQARLLVIRASGLGVNLALNAVLLPRIGVQGAALATVCSEVLVLALMLRQFRDMEWRRILPRAARLAVLGLASGLAMVLLGAVHPLAGMAGGVVIYALGVLFGRVLGTDDWDLLYRLTAALPGGSVVLRRWKRDTAINW